MIVYIAGKMTGLINYGRHNFSAAETRLVSRGHIVLNPAVLPIGMPKERYMPICLSMIDAADAVYALDNWVDSPGARLEVDYAAYKGKTILYEGEV